MFLAFAVLGLILLAAAAALTLRNRSFLASAATADGVVTEIVWRSGGESDSAHPRVRFQTAGGRQIEFVGNVGSNPPAFRVNDRVRILYDPADPSKASIDSLGQLWFPALLCAGVGTVFLGIGIIPFFWNRHVRRRADWLRANGRRIQADFDRVEYYTDYVVAGQSPYRIVCKALDPFTNQVRTFHSQNIWYDPTKYITTKTLDVMVDPNHPERYFVITDFLPDRAG
jgi:hypothetical protein